MFLTPLYLKLRRIQFHWIAFFYLVMPVLHADIITDGTAGSAQTLSGPNFTIPEDLGTRAGDNLFHSFEQFNIATGEQATFTGSPTINNVISRVTGGEASTINGLLRSEVGQADFYFINPSGVVFGADAQIDVPASFYVSTADELRFADDTVYSASKMPASSWSVAQPESFGFLGDQTASINVTQSELILTPGSKLAMSAGELSIDRAHLLTDRGEIQLVVTGNIPMELTTEGELSDIAQGRLDINNSIIDASREHIIIQSGASRINSSELTSNNPYPFESSLHYGININSQSLQIINSSINSGPVGISWLSYIPDPSYLFEPSLNYGLNNGININSQSLQMTNSSIKINNHPFGELSREEPGITINIEDQLSITEGSSIKTSTSRSNNAGHITINSGQVFIDNQSGIISFTDSTEGKSGDIILTIRNAVNITNGGYITNQSDSDGDTGNITLNAQELLIGGPSSSPPSLTESTIASIGQLRPLTSSSNLGTIHLNIGGTISLLNGGFIYNNENVHIIGDPSSFLRPNTTNVGNIEVTANRLLIKGSSPGILSQTHDNAKGGDIILNINDILLIDFSAPFSPGFGPDAAGNIISGIISSTSGVSDGGNITIRAGTISIYGIITSSSTSGSSILKGSAGNISIFTGGELLISKGEINSTSNSEGSAGNITVQASVVDVQNSRMSTSSRQGNGGNIILNSDVLVLDNGLIQANTEGNKTSGGNIQVNANALIASHNNLQTTSFAPLDFQAGINTIQSAAPNGTNGNITITTPQLNISGDLASLKSDLLDIDQITQNPCIAPGAKQSTLVSLGHGGLPESPEQAGSITLDAERLQQLLPLSKPIPNSSSSAPDSKLAQQPAWQATTECQP